MKKYVVLSILYASLINTHLWADLWQDMQTKYTDLCTQLETKYSTSDRAQYCSDYWQSQCLLLKNILINPKSERLWFERFLHQNMIRSGIEISQQYEICHLKFCLSKPVQQLINAYKDVELPGIFRECKEFNCSTNTLGHLFYVSKILEKAHAQEKTIKTIIEFGAGYGNLARVFKHILPEATLILFDLPEFLALQYYFLKLTNNNIEIIMHTELPVSFKPGAIHLVPVYFLPTCTCTADIFVSTFALSEVTLKTQQIVIQKSFFNAWLSYITGQLNGGTEVIMENHRTILTGIRNCYKQVDCQPFHNLFQDLKSYELIGIN